MGITGVFLLVFKNNKNLKNNYDILSNIKGTLMVPFVRHTCINIYTLSSVYIMSPL